MSRRSVPNHFAVAFSLAGEQRHLVRPIAEHVERRLGRSQVFYDEWYEHWTAGLDSDLLLQHLYAKKSELVVICVSGEYGNKAWPRNEYRAARERLMQVKDAAERHRVLPLRVADGEVDGILMTGDHSRCAQNGPDPGGRTDRFPAQPRT